MGDPLSVVASIIPILELAGAVVKFLSDVKNASTTCTKILDEVSYCTGLLCSIKTLFEKDGFGEECSIIATSLKAPNGPLMQLESTLMQIRRRLEPVARTKNTRGAIVWPFRQDEVANLLAAIERQKVLLAIVLHGDHM
jgi:hypothetical protein